MWALSVSAPNPALFCADDAVAAAQSSVETTAPPQPPSSFGRRRSSSGFKLDFSSSGSYDVSSPLGDCTCADEATVLPHAACFDCGGLADHLDERENPFRFKFFGSPPGLQCTNLTTYIRTYCYS